MIGEELTLEAQGQGAYELRDADGFLLLKGQVGRPARLRSRPVQAGRRSSCSSPS